VHLLEQKNIFNTTDAQYSYEDRDITCAYRDDKFTHILKYKKDGEQF
jgi:hypothetical protein